MSEDEVKETLEVNRLLGERVRELEDKLKANEDLSDNLQGMVKMRDQTIDDMRENKHAQQGIIREYRARISDLETENKRLREENERLENLSNNIMNQQ